MDSLVGIAITIRVVLARLVGLVGAVVLAPHPPGHAEERETHRAALHESPARGGVLLARREHFPVGIDRIRRRRRLTRTRLLAALRRRDPACDEDERFGRTEGTLLGVVHFFAIETETGVP